MSESKEKKFELVFRKYFKELHGYAYRMLEDGDMAEEAGGAIGLSYLF